jgi:hypothetical protein
VGRRFEPIGQAILVKQNHVAQVQIGDEFRLLDYPAQPVHRVEAVIDLGAILVVGDIAETAETLFLPDRILEDNEHRPVVAQVGFVLEIGADVGHGQDHVVVGEDVQRGIGIRPAARQQHRPDVLPARGPLDQPPDHGIGLDRNAHGRYLPSSNRQATPIAQASRVIGTW